ncbi:MAG: helix-turn-helix transcriptional regulator [Anaerolineae bacterium]|nr:helix-turn-helix transcriptional regulator [Anaerolineae bacterium]
MTKATSELSPRYVVMGFLYIYPMHGYDLHKHLEANLHEVWRISQSQTYNILKYLKKEGLVTATLQQIEKRPDRELLTLTDSGKIEFEAWLFAPTPSSSRAIRVEFITRLFFASNLSEHLCSHLIQEQANALRIHLEGLYARLNTIPRDQIFNRMGLELRIEQLKSVLSWVENAMEYFVEGIT